MKNYITPDFEVMIYEIEEIITDSSPIIGDKDPDGDGWWG